MNDELPQFSGHPVIDRHGTEVGMITDVVYDETTEEPTWGVVSPGLLHARHYIPLSPPVYSRKPEPSLCPTTRVTCCALPRCIATTSCRPCCGASWSITTHWSTDSLDRRTGIDAAGHRRPTALPAGNNWRR